MGVQDAKSHCRLCLLPLASDHALSMFSLFSLFDPHLSPFSPTLSVSSPTWPPHPSFLCAHCPRCYLLGAECWSCHPLFRTFYGTSTFPPYHPPAPCSALEACHNLALTDLPTYCSLLPLKPAGLQPNHLTPIPEARLYFPSLYLHSSLSKAPFSLIFSDPTPLPPSPVQTWHLLQDALAYSANGILPPLVNPGFTCVLYLWHYLTVFSTRLRSRN